VRRVYEHHAESRELTWACHRQENLVYTEGKLGGGNHSKSNGDRSTLACHSVDPVGFFKNTTVRYQASEG